MSDDDLKKELEGLVSKKTKSGENKKAAIAGSAEVAADKTVIRSGEAGEVSDTFAEEPTMPGIGIGPLPTPFEPKPSGSGKKGE